MIIYPFYIDKRLNCKTNENIDVKLLYPIIANDDESLYIEIKDIQYVNNLYNVSQYLQNNIITLNKTYRTYDIVNITGVGGNETIINIADDIYDSTLSTLEKYKENTILNYDTTNNIFKISNTKYDMEYKTDTLTNNQDPFIISLGLALNHYNNIFIDNVNNQLNFKPETHYIIFSNKSASGDLMKTISYKLKYNGSVPIISELLFTLKIEGSNDKLIWNEILPLINDTLNISWGYGETTAIKGVNNVNLINNIPYRYYKLSILRINMMPVDNPNLYDAFKLNFIEMKKTTYNVGYTETPVKVNITIPDGFYKISSYISTINNLLESHNIILTYNNINNKISISNNSTFIPSYLSVDMDAITYIYFKSKNLQINIGSEKETFLLSRGITYNLENGINLINSQKIILTTNLELEMNTHNEIIGGNDLATGLGDIICWLNNDTPPLSCVNYENMQNTRYKIKNKQINNIIFNIYNEKSQQIALDNMLISFHIIKL